MRTALVPREDTHFSELVFALQIFRDCSPMWDLAYGRFCGGDRKSKPAPQRVLGKRMSVTTRISHISLAT
jgi:hypothetical protein